MKIEDYMKLKYKMNVSLCKDSLEEKAYYMGTINEFPGFIATGDNIQELLEDAASAKRAWLETAFELGRDIPKPASEPETITYAFA